MDLLKALMDKENGVTALEYGLIAALVSVAIITACRHLAAIFTPSSKPSPPASKQPPRHE